MESQRNHKFRRPKLPRFPPYLSRVKRELRGQFGSDFSFRSLDMVGMAPLQKGVEFILGGDVVKGLLGCQVHKRLLPARDELLNCC